MSDLILKPGREKSLVRRHPWIFSGAVRELLGKALPGETVTVRDARGSFLASAAYSPASQIIARVWSWDEQEAVDSRFFERRLRAAISSPYRQEALRNTQYAIRLVSAESDGLPGLIVDYYSGFLVIQSLTAGTEYWKAVIVQALSTLIAPVGIYERSELAVRQKEGLLLVRGTLAGETPPDRLEIEESGLRFLVDVKGGHKTGWYLDQRESRKLVKEYAQGREVLDVFCYSGGFTLLALEGGAMSVVCLDSAAGALELLGENLELNGYSPEKTRSVGTGGPPDVWILEGDAFKVLREYRDAAKQFDLIILDPPKFAHSANQVERAARGYKDINLLAFKLLRPGGILFTFSCSGAIPPDLFQKIVAGAALDAGVEVQILRRLSQAPDHPVALNFPEGEYLKGLVCLRS